MRERSSCGEPSTGASSAALASALYGLARRETIRERLATGGLSAVRERSWERSLAQLGEGYARAIDGGSRPGLAHAA